jgi:predicted deacylase
VSRVEEEDLPTIAGTPLPTGRRTNLELRVARLPTGTWVSLPIAVLRGQRPGPGLWLSAAVHGDELNGIEIVRQILPLIDLDRFQGTLIAAPIVNVFGFLNRNRYLPDRRDLNRTFPGSVRGSLAARLARLFMDEVVAKCDYGIDLHTGSQLRTNLPQIRANLDEPETRRLAEAFGAPIAIPAKPREGSLRQAASALGCSVLVYEAGEILRFDRRSIRAGVRGILRVLDALEMYASHDDLAPAGATRFVEKTHWARAPRGGFLLVDVELGQTVEPGDVLARVTDTFSEDVREVLSTTKGLVIGLTTNPVANRGDAVVHIADL